ncbi:uncharacterized protein LOC108246492 [Kryptolebias marmoratus]|uniref:uncharacterized protein LOC108246492 n=1 Tax=Kryptolebias marmoratus TaxID=37003 RepID=UPI0007F8A358|nr:uncharacterized protein LOC108246492 [Kryptolebias marmoratus]
MLSGGRPRGGERRRTVVVSGVPGVLPDGRMADKLTVHFQRVRRSHGGDVEVVRYPTCADGVAFVTFDRAEDADRAARKERHVMEDDELPEDYALTVFRFSEDVFLYVSGTTVDLSVFGGDQARLVESLRLAHRSIRFWPFPERREAVVEGPLSAVMALRDDLVSRAERLKSPVQTAAVRPKDARSNPGGAARPEIVGSSDAKAPSGSQESRQDASGGRLRHVTGEESNAGGVPASGRAQPKEGGSPGKKRHQLGRTAGGRSRAELLEASPEQTVDPFPEGGEVVWVDSDTFKYVETLQKKELEACVKDVNVLIDGVEGGGLLKILLTENKPSGSRHLKAALDRFQTLIQFWSALLKVHDIHYDKSLTEKELTSICGAANARYKDVLYAFEDRRVKVIGPTPHCYLFCSKVEEMFELCAFKIRKNKNKDVQFHY